MYHYLILSFLKKMFELFFIFLQISIHVFQNSILLLKLYNVWACYTCPWGLRYKMYMYLVFHVTPGSAWKFKKKGLKIRFPVLLGLEWSLAESFINATCISLAELFINATCTSLAELFINATCILMCQNLGIF